MFLQKELLKEILKGLLFANTVSETFYQNCKGSYQNTKDSGSKSFLIPPDALDTLKDGIIMYHDIIDNCYSFAGSAEIFSEVPGLEEKMEDLRSVLKRDYRAHIQNSGASIFFPGVVFELTNKISQELKFLLGSANDINLAS